LSAPLSKLRVVELIWIDSVAPVDAWRDQDDMNKFRPTKVVTAGYLVSESKKHVAVASSVTAGGESGGVIVIPKFAIQKMRKKKK